MSRGQAALPRDRLELCPADRQCYLARAEPDRVFSVRCAGVEGEETPRRFTTKAQRSTQRTTKQMVIPFLLFVCLCADFVPLW